MSIIVLMAVAAVAVTSNQTAATGAKQAAIMASNLLMLTRSEAIQKQGYACLIVDAYPDPNYPLNYLHRFMVVDSSGVPSAAGPNNFSQVSVWYNFPNSVYYDPNYSETTSYPVSISLSNGGTFAGNGYTYCFFPSGQLTSPAPFVVAVGHQTVTAGTPTMPIYEDGTTSAPNTLQGFYIHSAGRPSFFQNPLEITPVPTH